MAKTTDLGFPGWGLKSTHAATFAAESDPAVHSDMELLTTRVP